VIKRPELHDVLLFTGSTKWTWNEFESKSVKSYRFSCQRNNEQSILPSP